GGRGWAGRRRPKRVQPARTLGRGGRPPALPRARRGVCPVLPACEWPSDREVPPRRAAAPPVAPRGPADLLTSEAFDRIEALEECARARGHTLLELAIAGLASEPAVASVIAGAMSSEQVRQNAAAAEWELSADELAELRRL